MTPYNLPNQHQALEARLAGRLASALTQSSTTLPHDITERLRVARGQAMARARPVRQLQAAPAELRTGPSAGRPGAHWSIECARANQGGS